jgi:hypothetical protein
LRALGVDVDGLYDAVYPDAAGELEDGPYRVFLVVVYDLGSLRPGHLQTRLVLVYREDLPGAHYEGAGYSELAHGTAAKDRDRIAVANFGELRPKPAGREDIGEHDRLLVGDLIGQLDAVHGGERYPRVLGLHPVERPRRLRSLKEGRSRLGPLGLALSHWA